MSRQIQHDKYREALKDLALGGDSAADAWREHELLAHAAECDACREAYGHAQEFRRALDASLARIAAGEPSPEFETRLRARLAQAARSSRASDSTRARWLRPAAGVVFALAALALVFVLRDWRPGTRAPGPAALLPEHGMPGGRAPGPALRTPNLPLYARHAASHLAPGRSVAALAKRHTERAMHKSAEPEVPAVIIPPGQIEAFEQLAAAVASGQIDPKQFAAEQARFEAEANQPIEIKPIEIKPVEIKPIEVKTIPIPAVDVNASTNDSAGSAAPASDPGAAPGAPLRSGLHWIGLAP